MPIDVSPARRFLLAFRSLSITIIATVILGIPAVLAALVDRTGRAPYRIGQVWARLIMLLNGVRVRVTGLDAIDRNESYVFISNHQSNLDGLAIGAALPSPLRFIIKKSLLKIPIMGQAFRLGRMIPIERGDSARAIETINRSAEELTGGISALFFGEGRRTRDGRLLPFKKGGFIFAIAAGLPLVPVTVVNSYSLFPSGSLHIRRGVIEIIIDPPIRTQGMQRGDADALRDRVRGMIRGNLAGHGAEPDRPG